MRFSSWSHPTTSVQQACSRLKDGGLAGRSGCLAINHQSTLDVPGKSGSKARDSTSACAQRYRSRVSPLLRNAPPPRASVRRSASNSASMRRKSRAERAASGFSSAQMAVEESDLAPTGR